MDGVQKEVKSYAKGDFFGELALLKNEPRAATVVAKGALTCASLGRKPFTRLVGACDEILMRNQELYDEINSKLTGEGGEGQEQDLQAQNASLRSEVSALTIANEKLKSRVAELEAAA